MDYSPIIVNMALTDHDFALVIKTSAICLLFNCASTLQMMVNLRAHDRRYSSSTKIWVYSTSEFRVLGLWQDCLKDICPS